MAFAAFLSLLLWAYHLFLIAGLLRMCEFHHVSPLNISIVSLSAQICHAQLHQGDQANHQRIPSRRPPVEICGIAQRGSNGAPTVPRHRQHRRGANALRGSWPTALQPLGSGGSQRSRVPKTTLRRLGDPYGPLGMGSFMGS